MNSPCSNKEKCGSFCYGHCQPSTLNKEECEACYCRGHEVEEDGDMIEMECDCKHTCSQPPAEEEPKEDMAEKHYKDYFVNQWIDPKMQEPKNDGLDWEEEFLALCPNPYKDSLRWNKFDNMQGDLLHCIRKLLAKARRQERERCAGIIQSLFYCQETYCDCSKELKEAKKQILNTTPTNE